MEEDGKKISYFDYISSLKDRDCNAALRRIHERIDMEQIDQLVAETPFTEPIQREFYQVMIRERKEKILDYSIEQLMKLEKQQDRVQEQEPPAQTM